VSGYIQFSPFIISLIVLLVCAAVHARFIQLLNCMIVWFPFYFHIFLLCIQLVYTH